MKPAPALKPEQQQQKHEAERDVSHCLQITVNED